MYSHLLVPLDGSELTPGLVEIAINYAKATGASITFFHSVRDFGATDEGALQRTIDPHAFEERTSNQLQNILGPAIAAASAAGVTAQGKWGIAEHPHAAIQAAATSNGCDLILIASHGKRGINRLLLGSQTAKVVAESPLPVLVVRVPH